MSGSNLKRLIRDKHMLYIINKAKPKLRKAILKNCPPSLIKTISEICFNVLKGNCNLKQKALKGLKKYKNQLRFLACGSKSLDLKRARLIQSGSGILPLILAPLIVELFGRIV